jgi:hypothetical protein
LFWPRQLDFGKLSGFSMHQITIRLPCNRDYAGTLKLADAKGKLVAGPFQVCARAHDELARANGNPDRLPVLPFGDMPLGEYEVVRIVPSGPGTPFASDEFGSAGIVFLQPRHGEAVLADANGRFIFLIHGGALARNGALRPTEDGSLRLSNRNQRKFISALRRVGADACRCFVTNSGRAKRRVAIAAGAARSTHVPARGDATHSGPLAAAAAAGLAETSRRSWLRTMLIAAGAFASIPNLLRFFSPTAFAEFSGTDYGTNPPPSKCITSFLDNLAGDTYFAKFSNSCDQAYNVFYMITDGGKVIQDETSLIVRGKSSNTNGPYHCSPNARINIVQIVPA